MSKHPPPDPSMTTGGGKTIPPGAPFRPAATYDEARDIARELQSEGWRPFVRPCGKAFRVYYWHQDGRIPDAAA